MAPRKTIPLQLFKPGSRFDHWTVIVNPSPPFRTVLCRCDCGTTKHVYLTNLNAGLSKRCRHCSVSDRCRTHGASDAGGKKAADRLYRIWKAMKWRCNPKNATADHQMYYDRGVRVCQEWIHDYPAFRDWSLANGYVDDLSIDRYPDLNGNYEPTNCRWVNQTQQARNTKANRYLTAFGETKTVVEWSEDKRCKTNEKALRRRLKLGWDDYRAITTPTAA